MIIVAALVLIVMGGIIIPQTWKDITEARRISALHQGRSIACALTDFHQDFGSYPNEQTARTLLRADTDTEAQLSHLAGTCSNSYFRQLIVAGVIDTEAIFHIGLGSGFLKPDDRIDYQNAIAAGENGYGYLLPATNEPNTISNSDLPLIFAGMDQTSPVRFRTDIFEGRCIIIRRNLSAESPQVEKDGSVPEFLSSGADANLADRLRLPEPSVP